MNLLAIALAAFVFVSVFDRVRLINWKTARFRSMALYVAIDAAALWSMYGAFTSGAEWWQVIGLGVIALCLVVSRENWRHGVPDHVSTLPADLGAPELRKSP